jgi:hypothetical protein
MLEHTEHQRHCCLRQINLGCYLWTHTVLQNFPLWWLIDSTFSCCQGWNKTRMQSFDCDETGWEGQGECLILQVVRNLSSDGLNISTFSKITIVANMIRARCHEFVGCFTQASGVPAKCPTGANDCYLRRHFKTCSITRLCSTPYLWVKMSPL